MVKSNMEAIVIAFIKNETFDISFSPSNFWGVKRALPKTNNVLDDKWQRNELQS